MSQQEEYQDDERVHSQPLGSPSTLHILQGVLFNGDDEDARVVNGSLPDVVVGVSTTATATTTTRPTIVIYPTSKAWNFYSKPEQDDVPFQGCLFQRPAESRVVIRASSSRTLETLFRII